MALNSLVAPLRNTTTLLWALLLLWCWPGNATAVDETGRHPNVLFVIVDDLRPEFGCYGNTEILNPSTTTKRSIRSWPMCDSDVWQRIPTHTPTAGPMDFPPSRSMHPTPNSMTVRRPTLHSKHSNG